MPPLYFLHIPKTAGTSLKGWLNEFYNQEDELGIELPQALQTVTRQKINDARLISGHFGWQMFQNFDRARLAITWLRDPVKRAISNFRYIRENLPNLISRAKGVGCEEWIDYFERCSRQSFDEMIDQGMYEGYVDNLQTRHLADCLADKSPLLVNETVLERAKQNLAKLSFVGFTEWMSQSIDLCCYHLGFPSHRVIQKLNATSSGDRTGIPLISEEGKRRLASIERFDRQLYDWAKVRFEQQLSSFWQTVHEGRQPRSGESADGQHHSSFEQILRDYDRPEIQTAIRRALNQSFYAQQTFLPVMKGELNFADVIVQDGWHPRWLFDDGTTLIRWAGPNPTSSVMFPFKQGADYEVVFLVYRHAGPQFIEKMTIYANGVPVPSKFRSFNDLPYKALVWFLVPRTAVRSNGPTEILIKVPDALKPADFGDNPKMSFATNGFRFCALTSDRLSFPIRVDDLESIFSVTTANDNPVASCLPLPPSGFSGATAPVLTTSHKFCSS